MRLRRRHQGQLRRPGSGWHDGRGKRNVGVGIRIASRTSGRRTCRRGSQRHFRQRCGRHLHDSVDVRSRRPGALPPATIDSAGCWQRRRHSRKLCRHECAGDDSRSECQRCLDRTPRALIANNVLSGNILHGIASSAAASMARRARSTERGQCGGDWQSHWCEGQWRRGPAEHRHWRVDQRAKCRDRRHAPPPSATSSQATWASAS